MSTPVTNLRGTDNLRLYLRSATLPQMILGPGAPSVPMPGYKSHANDLTVRPAPWRFLETMVKIMPEKFKQIVESFLNARVTCEPINVESEDEHLEETLSVSCPPTFSIPKMRLRRPDDIRGVSEWLNLLALQTTEAVMHLTFPETRAWNICPQEEKDVDEQIFKYSYWTQPANSASPHPIPAISRHSVIIAFQPPWILSPRDLINFQRAAALPNYILTEDPNSLYRSQQRVWAKLWDLCKNKDCPWFVLSTHWGWVFGAFSEGWSRAWVSPIISFDGTAPTVLECLVYWFASAAGIEGGYQIPQVLEPVRAESENSVQILQERFEQSVSESDWSSPSVAGEKSHCSLSGDNLSDAVSDSGIRTPTAAPPPIRMPVPLDVVNARVNAWQYDYPSPEPIPFAPSPIPSDSEWSTHSDEDEVGEGHWMAGVPQGSERIKEFLLEERRSRHS